MKQYFVLVVLMALFSSCGNENRNSTALWLISSPAGSEYTGIDKEGRTVLPNGRFITPAGKSIEVAPHPYGLTLSRDGKLLQIQEHRLFQ